MANEWDGKHMHTTVQINETAFFWNSVIQMSDSTTHRILQTQSYVSRWRGGREQHNQNNLIYIKEYNKNKHNNVQLEKGNWVQMF